MTDTLPAPALAGQDRPRLDAEVLRQLAGRLGQTAQRCDEAGSDLRRAHAELAPRWRGTAADAARAVVATAQQRAERADDAHTTAAQALQVCAGRLEDADTVWRQAEALERQDVMERLARAGPRLPGSDDPWMSPVRLQAQRLAAEARQLADDANTHAAMVLHELAVSAPQPARQGPPVLTAAEQGAGLGKGLVDAIWGSVVAAAQISLPRLLVDREGWLEHVRGLRDGAVYAKDHPKEAILAAVGWDLVEDGKYGEWVGGLLPDVAGAVASGGGLPMARRSADVSAELADLGKDVNDLQRVHDRRPVGSPERGGPVQPQPGALMTPRYPAKIQDLSAERRRHILDGDPPNVNDGVGGGHRAGTGKSGKSEFPPGWSDEDIIRRVLETARRPERTEDQPGKVNLLATATFEGVVIRVAVSPDGRVVTAYPKSGPGVTRNRRLSRRP